MIVGHGGNIYETAKALGCQPTDIIDMSSNVNPLGPLPGLMEYLGRHFKEICALPEVDAHTIRALFSKAHNLDPALVLAGNGTTEFIYTLPLALKSRSVLILAPTYADYADSCSMHHVAYEYLVADEARAFQVEIRQIEQNLDGHDTVFICNPNNPTGTLMSSGVLTELCNHHPEITFIIDESYLPFSDQFETDGMMGAGLPNTIVLNSMSKIFRIPGLRIGFIHASEANIAKLQHYMRPWTVNSMAHAAVRYLMTQTDEVTGFIRGSRAYLEAEKKALLAALEGHPALKTFDTTTSFILARLAPPLTASEVLDFLRNDRILIRNCANFAGLSEQFIRISIKTREANRSLAEKLTKLTVDCSR